jgi:hypothetical protein
MPGAPFDWDGKPSWTSGDIFVRSITITLHAWEPWDFARNVLFEIQNSDIDDEHPEWRMHWFSGVVALRAVGHVLNKVDASRSAAHRHVIDAWWVNVRSDDVENWIFHEFIERERNNILKEFSFGASLPPTEDGRLLAYDGSHRDGAQLFREAIYWWRGQLEFLEDKLRRG